MFKWLVFGLSLLLVTELVAEEKVKLEEVVVTALRTKEEVEKLPANVTVITEEDIRISAATTVQDLLREEEGLIIRDLFGTGTKSTVDMRGFGRGLNTAILIDGRKVNEIDLSGVDWNLIPLENVERIETVRGGGSVLYGDNAMAGVINIITKKGETKGPEFEFGSKLESYSRNVEHLTVKGATDRLSYFLLGKHNDTDGYRDNSHFKSKDLSGNLTCDITSVSYANFRMGYHVDDQGFPGYLTEEEMNQNRRQTTVPNDGVEYDQYYYGVELGYAPWKHGEFEFGSNFNSREFDSNVYFFGTPFNIVRDTDTRELNLKFTSRYRLKDHDNLLITGVDRHRSHVDNVSIYSGSTTASDIEKTELGLYVQDKFSLNDKLSFTLGYRNTETEFKDVVSGASSGRGNQSINESAVSTGITYNYTGGAKFFISYSRDYRLPTTDEIFAFTGEIVNLKHEKSHTYESGFVHPFNKSLRTRITFYYMDVRDELFFNQATFANENADKTKHRGVELGFDANPIESISFSGSWTHTRANFETGTFDGKTIPTIPENSVGLRTTVKPGDSILFSTNVNWVDKRFLDNDLENTSAMLEDYFTVDTKASYKYKEILAFIGVKNIFDKEYSEYGVLGSTGNRVYYPAPGRSFYGGLKTVF
jgi:iron complex outermembrane receptor protein